MSINSNITNLSESFLHFLDDDNFNKNRQTFCEEQSNTYHDSSYIWCKLCDKIFCMRCSLNHLINNQIDHTPSEKIFLRKEHFDVEFNRDLEKLNEIKRNIDEFFTNNNNKNINLNDYNELKETVSLLKKFTKQLIEAIDDFQKKIKICLENIQNKYKNISVNNLKEEHVRAHTKELYTQFKIIEKNYYNCQTFHPSQLKFYYENLSSAYNDCKKLNDLIMKNKSKNNYSSEISGECSKFKNILNNAINQVKGCKDNFDKLLNDLKI